MLGLAGSFFGAIVGGSGLLILPGLILLGLPATQAVAVLEVGALGMMFTGAFELNRISRINLKVAMPITLLSGVGAFIGASFLVATPGIVAEKLFGFGLILLLVYSLVDEGLRRRMRKQRESTVQPESLAKASFKDGGKIRQLLRTRHTEFGFFLLFLNGVWTGFFSAGSHLLANFILLVWFRKSMLEASGLLKIEGIGTGVVTSVTFASFGLIDWSAALVLSLAMSVGARIGIRLGASKGDAWLRGLYFTVVGVSALKLLF